MFYGRCIIALSKRKLGDVTAVLQRYSDPVGLDLATKFILVWALKEQYVLFESPDNGTCIQELP